MLTSCGITVRNTRQMNLKKIQHEAARIGSGATKLVLIEKNIKRSLMGYSVLPKKKHKQILFYKMIN